MKFSLTIILLALSVCLESVRAQEPPLPAKTETPTPGPDTRPQLNIPEIPISIEPPQLAPISPAPAKNAPALSELDAAFQRSPLATAAEEYRLHIEWRQLQNRTAHDPEVVAAKTVADRARTDLEKRARLRAYYTVYYAHMQALASTPEVKNYLDGKKNAALGGLAQPRVRPEPEKKIGPARR